MLLLQKALLSPPNLNDSSKSKSSGIKSSEEDHLRSVLSSVTVKLFVDLLQATTLKHIPQQLAIFSQILL